MARLQPMHFILVLRASQANGVVPQSTGAGVEADDPDHKRKARSCCGQVNRDARVAPDGVRLIAAKRKSPLPNSRLDMYRHEELSAAPTEDI